MKVEKIQVHFDNGEVRELNKTFAVDLTEQGLDVFFIDMDAMEVLTTVNDLEYEIMHMIKNGGVSDSSEIEYEQ